MLADILTGVWEQDDTISLIPDTDRVRYWGRKTAFYIMRISHFLIFLRIYAGLKSDEVIVTEAYLGQYQISIIEFFWCFHNYSFIYASELEHFTRC